MRRALVGALALALAAAGPAFAQDAAETSSPFSGASAVEDEYGVPAVDRSPRKQAETGELGAVPGVPGAEVQRAPIVVGNGSEEGGGARAARRRHERGAPAAEGPAVAGGKANVGLQDVAVLAFVLAALAALAALLTVAWRVRKRLVPPAAPGGSPAGGRVAG